MTPRPRRTNPATNPPPEEHTVTTNPQPDSSDAPVAARETPTLPPDVTVGASGGDSGTRQRVGTSGDAHERAEAHLRISVEYEAAGSPLLCPCCGGYDRAGVWTLVPTCAQSTLTHEQICVGKHHADDVCAACSKRLGWTS